MIQIYCVKFSKKNSKQRLTSFLDVFNKIFDAIKLIR